MGRGKIDWRALFAAADPQHVKHYFVEQENFERPALESVRMSYAHLRTLG